MANKPGEANFFPDVPKFPSMGTFQPVYGKFDLTTYIQGASDYEIMAFLVGKYNACLEAYGNITKLSTDTITACKQLQDWINSWFTNLDVQEELNKKIDSMVADGSFGQLLHKTFDTQINKQTTNAVTAWLVANVTPTGSAVVVDKSLTIGGAAADAKVTGDAIGTLNEDVSDIENGIDNAFMVLNGDAISFTWLQGTYASTGIYDPNTTTQITTPMFKLPVGTKISMTLINPGTRSILIREYEYSNGTWKNTVKLIGGGSLTYTTTAFERYITLSLYVPDGVTPSASSDITVSFSNVASEVVQTVLQKAVVEKTTEETDCNNLVKAGMYNVNTSFTNKPSDMDNNGVVAVFNGNSTGTTRIIQMAGQYQGKRTIPKLWFRVSGTSNGSFSNWVRAINNNTVKISKTSADSYRINFGKYYTNLVHVVNKETNSNLWNLLGIYYSDGTNIVTTGTDIIGPIKEVGESDFMGGVHGDEKTTKLLISCDGIKWDTTSTVECQEIKIIMTSELYRVSSKDHIYNRFVTITITNGKIKIENNYKCIVTDSILERATNGGLIAIQNPKLLAVSMNNFFADTAPTSSVNNYSKNNTSATLYWTNGSITLNNIIGHEQDTYTGFLVVFTNEKPMRNKVYMDVIKSGRTQIKNKQEILGAFEYLFN